MRLQGFVVKTKAFERQLPRILEKLRVALDFKHEKWADALQLSLKEYKQVYPTGGLPINALISICDRFNLSLNSFKNGTIDHHAAAAHYLGDAKYIPERYTIAAFSKKKTLLNILDYIETFFGTRKRSEMLREFQVTEASLANPEESVNIVLMADVFQRIARMNPNPELFKLMGSSSIASNRMSPLKKLFSACGSTSKMYEDLINNYVSFFEKNCTYAINKLTRKEGVVFVRSNAEVRELLGMKELGNEHICHFKSGMLSAFPKLIGLPSAQVNKTSCVHHGDAFCRYEMNFERAEYIATHKQMH